MQARNLLDGACLCDVDDHIAQLAVEVGRVDVPLLVKAVGTRTSACVFIYGEYAEADEVSSSNKGWSRVGLEMVRVNMIKPSSSFYLAQSHITYITNDLGPKWDWNSRGHSIVTWGEVDNGVLNC